jgi:hypothetical protein
MRVDEPEKVQIAGKSRMGRMEGRIEMKRFALLTMSLLIMGMMTPTAWADGTAQTYQGSMLVLLFLGVCALIVVAQMVPALILMMGTISGIAKRVAARKQVAVVNIDKDETEEG